MFIKNTCVIPMLKHDRNTKMFMLPKINSVWQWLDVNTPKWGLSSFRRVLPADQSDDVTNTCRAQRDDRHRHWAFTFKCHGEKDTQLFCGNMRSGLQNKNAELMTWKPLPYHWPFVRGIHRPQITKAGHLEHWLCFVVSLCKPKNKDDTPISMA